MLEKVAEVAWDSYPRPSYAKDCRAAEALRCLYSASDLHSARDAGGKLTWAVGNDHSGTYFPALVGVLPFLEDLLRNGTSWARTVVLGFLSDMLITFQPESGFEEFTDSSGGRHNVEAEFRAWMLALGPLLSDLAQRRDESSDSARELLAEIDENGG